MQSLLDAGDIVACEASFSGRRWALRAADERQTLAVAQRAGIPDLVARMLVARGVTAETASAFLAPSLRAHLPNPSVLRDMDAASERVAAAVMAGERVAVFGDYDVDGATASALLAQYFRALGREARVYIPDRMKEGYGPNIAAFTRLRDEGATVIITVDCGTAAFEPLAKARAMGLDVIVLDHHISEGGLPEAFAVVNPNRMDESKEYGQLAAVGVTFLFLVALSRTLRGAGWFATRQEPDLKQWLDLVALGTVCDVVPLTGVNRVLVAQGLKIMAARGNVGLRALMDNTKLQERPGVYHAGYVLGPRINAGGRVGAADLGVRLLTAQDEAEAMQLAAQLEQHNADRKAIEAAVQAEAMAQAEKMADAPVIIVSAGGWHPGVIGIVAGRIKEKFDKPVAVIALENGIGKASARSVTGADIGGAVTAARAAGLLVAGGGHAMAAGFTVEEEKIPALAAFLGERLAAPAAAYIAQRALWLDGVLPAESLTIELAALIEQGGPYGAGHPAPRFMLRDLRVVRADVFAGKHVRVIGVDGRGTGTAKVTATYFNSAETQAGQALVAAGGKRFHLAGQVRVETWQGRENARFIIDDVARAE